MKKSVYILMLALFALVVACSKIPRGIIEPDELEEILYDYHLTQAMVDNMTEEERGDNMQRYVDAVWKKHGITQAEFDSSMVWYNGHEKYLSEIYSHLNDRFVRLDEQLRMQTGGETYGFATEGDTANIWPDAPMVVLRNSTGKNRKLLTIKSDSTFRHGDMFSLYARTSFVKDNSKTNNNNIFIIVGLNVEYADGACVGTEHEVYNDDRLILRLETDKDKEIKQVNANIFYRGLDDMRNLCFLRDIALVRIHTVEEEKPKADSLSVDSLGVDSLGVDSSSIDSVVSGKLK